MRILIIGDGKVGYALAEQLTNEQHQNHEVTIVDNSAAALHRAVEKLDVLCVEGSGSSISTLKEAGVERADLFIAVTSSDEINMISSMMAHRLGAGRIVARIRNPEYATNDDFLRNALGIDMSINPELNAANDIARLLRYPHAHSVESFVRGRMEVVELELDEHSPILGVTLAELRPTLPARILFGAVQREDEAFIPNGDTVLMEGDRIFVIGEPQQQMLFSRHLKHDRRRIRDVMIVGGSRIGFYLAKQLPSSRMRCVLIESDLKRCDQLSRLLPDAVVIHGDGTDQELLDQERLEEMHAFIALTDRDEENIIAGMYARDIGLRRVIAKVTRSNYERLAKGLSLISPKDLAASRIVRYVRAMVNSEGSFVEKLYRILRGEVDVMEFTAGKSAHLLGTPLKNLRLKKGLLVAAIVHKGQIVIPFGDDMIREGDSVVIVTGSGQAFIDLNDILE